MSQTEVVLTVRATVNTDELARHLTADPELQQVIREGGAAGALVTHISQMLEQPSWDSPAVLKVTAAVSERRER